MGGRSTPDPKFMPHTPAQLKKNTISYMESIVKDKEKVMNFFKHPSIAYAA